MTSGEGSRSLQKLFLGQALHLMDGLFLFVCFVVVVVMLLFNAVSFHGM